MRFYLNPVESDEYPGFYLVPDIERLVVSKQGHFKIEYRGPLLQ